MVRTHNGATHEKRPQKSTGYAAGSLAEMGSKKRANPYFGRWPPSKKKVLHGGASLPNRRSVPKSGEIVKHLKLSDKESVIANHIVVLLSKKENHAMALADIKIKIEQSLTPAGQRRILLPQKAFKELYRNLVFRGAVIDPNQLAIIQQQSRLQR